MSHPLDPVNKIEERLRERAAELGLELVQFALISDGRGSHAVQAIFALPEEMKLDNPEPELDELELPPECAPVPELDDELAGIWAATADQEKDEIRKAQEEEDRLREEAERQQQEEQLAGIYALRKKMERRDKGFLDD